MRHLRFLLFFSALVGMAMTAIPAGAQSLDDIAASIDRDGSYLEVELQDVALDAVDRANADGVGFVYLDQENAEDLPILTSGLLQRLDDLGSAYRTLIVLDASGAWVESLDRDTAGAADAAFAQFATGAVAGGIDTVLGVLDGGAVTDPARTSTSSSSGVPWLLILFLGLVAFLAVRFFSGRKRKAAALDAALAEDRAEIREQLRNNSDHVIDLGDRIAKADDDLRRMYEEAAQAFQDVSMGLEDAATAAEIDALDDRLDRAEWQFEVIEARLDGRTPPPEPTIGEGPVGRPSGRRPVPPLGDDRPALGDDESLFPGGRQSGRRGRQAPGRSGGGLGSGGLGSGGLGSGGLGSMVGGMARAGLLSLVIKMLLGGRLGARSGSRRTQQRRGAGGGFSGGVGGGVLR